MKLGNFGGWKGGQSAVGEMNLSVQGETEVKDRDM